MMLHGFWKATGVYTWSSLSKPILCIDIALTAETSFGTLKAATKQHIHSASHMHVSSHPSQLTTLLC